MSTITDFYKGTVTDDQGRTLMSYLDQDDEWWERCHNHVQWMFPLPEASRMQPGAPVATQDDYETFWNDEVWSPLLQARMLTSLGRFILFLDRTSLWRRLRDHNHLRITRAIRCLTLCGMSEAALLLFRYAEATVGGTVSDVTIWYWEEALKPVPEWLNRPL